MQAHKIVCIADKGIGIYSLLELCGCNLVSLNGLIEASFKLKDHQDFSIHLWEPIGQRNLGSLDKALIRKSIGCLIIYDLANISSMDYIKKRIEDLNDQVEYPLLVDEKFNFIVLGLRKTNRQEFFLEKVSGREINSWINNSMDKQETSSLQNQKNTRCFDIKEAFKDAIQRISIMKNKKYMIDQGIKLNSLKVDGTPQKQVCRLFLNGMESLKREGTRLISEGMKNLRVWERLQRIKKY